MNEYDHLNRVGLVVFQVLCNYNMAAAVAYLAGAERRNHINRK